MFLIIGRFFCVTTVKKGKDKADSNDVYNIKPKQVHIVGSSIELSHIIISHCGVHYLS